MITVNNFFCHWLKGIDTRRYPADVRILPINNTVKNYQYAVQQLKNVPRETLLYEKKAVVLTGGTDRRSNTSTTPADRTDLNLGERVTDFLALIEKKCTAEFHFGFLHS